MTPRLMAALAVGGVLLAAAAGLYWKGRLEGAAHERPKVEAALARAAVAGLVAGGERVSSQRVGAVVRQREAAARVIAQVTEEALKSEDADAPLDPARSERLRNADERLCDSAPALAGCAPASDAG